MIGLSSFVAAIGVAGVTAGAALLEGKPGTGFRRSIHIGATIGLWVLLWYALTILAISRAFEMSDLFGKVNGPRNITLASAAASWLVTILIVRAISLFKKRQEGRSLILGILLGLAWASLLLAPFILPAATEAYADMPPLLAATTLLAILVAPAARL
jgi:hypothetical protein